MKILTVIGARPQFVKSAIFSRWCETFGVNEVVCDSGQHYDFNMSYQIFEDLKINTPKYIFNNIKRNPSSMISDIMTRLEEVLQKERPDLINVFGDTTTTLAAAIFANKNSVQLSHIESGLRSGNYSQPEEINRKITDQLSDYLFCPTLNAVKNLEDEAHKGYILNTGDIMLDALSVFSKEIDMNKFETLPSRDFVIFTLHRAESLKEPKALQDKFDYVRSYLPKYEIIFPIHPNTKKHILSFDISLDGFNVVEPLSYLDCLSALQKCSMVFTDSGGLQKEAYFFKKPCVTLRAETEWKETIQFG